jgi:hypothetical protein
VIHSNIFNDFFSPLNEYLNNSSVKATEFPLIDPIQHNFPDAWRAQETIKSGRGIDKDFYPASKKGTDTHISAMHAANLIFALSLKASRASIQTVLKARYLLRSQKGEYFMNDFANYLTDPWNLVHIKEIRISTDRTYVEVIHSAEKENKIDVYSSDKFERQQAENFTILFHDFLVSCANELNHTHQPSADRDQIQAHVKSFKKIQNV